MMLIDQSLDFQKIESDNDSFDLTLTSKQRNNNKQEAKYWHHRKRCDNQLEQWLQDEMNLDPFAIEVLISDQSRPQCHSISNGLLIVLYGVNVDPMASDEDMVSLRMWIDEERLLTITQRPLLSLSRVRNKNDIASCLPNEIATRLIETITNTFKNTVEEVESRILDLDDRFINDPDSNISNPLKENSAKTIWLKRFASPQLHAIEEMLLSAFEKSLNKSQVGRVRQTLGVTQRLYETLSTLHEHALLLQRYLEGRRDEKRQKHIYIFTLMSGVFLPLNLFAGLLGANVGGIPLAMSPAGFAIICVSALIAGLVFAFLIRSWMLS